MQNLLGPFRDRLAAGFKPVVLVDITSSASAKAWRFVSGERRMFGHPNILTEMSPSNTGFDLRDRRWQIGRISLTVNGKWARNILANYVIFGSRVRIFLGFEDLNEPEFEATEFYRGVLGDPLPIGANVTLPVDSNVSVLLDSDVTGEWSGIHPLDARTRNFTLANLATELWDATSFDPQRSEWSDIAHWGCGRTGRSNNPQAPAMGNEIIAPQKAFQLDQELARLMPAYTAIGVDGKMRAIRLSRNQPKVRHLTIDDIIKCEQIGTFKDLANDITIHLGQDTLNSAFLDKRVGFRREDLNSQGVIKYPGAPTGRKIAEEESSPWLNQMVRTISTVTGAGPWTITLPFTAAMLGFAGCCVPYGERLLNATVPVAQRLSSAAGRYGYLMVEHTHQQKRDIFRATSVTFNWTNYAIDDYGQAWPDTISFSCDQRGLFDSNADATTFPTVSFCYDFTIPVMLSNEWLSWVSAGITVCRLQVRARHWDLEPGDTISFDDNIPCSPNFGDGVGDNVNWLIIDEQRDPLGAELWYTVVWLTTMFREAPPNFTVTTIPIETPYKDKIRTLMGDQALRVRVAETSHHAVVSTSGLTATIGSGKVTGGFDGHGGTRDQTTLTLQATRDNYVYRSALDSSFIVKPVTAAAAEPTRRADDVPIAMFRTNATDVTATADMRNARALDGSRLVASSVIRDVLANPVEQQSFRTAVTLGDLQKGEKTSHRVQTTNATVTTLGTSVINERETALAIGKISARRSAVSARATFFVTVLVYRDSGGNVTMPGAVTTIYSNADGSGYVATLDVDIASQTVRMRVTGVAAQTVEWFGELEVIRSFA